MPFVLAPSQNLSRQVRGRVGRRFHDPNWRSSLSYEFTNSGARNCGLTDFGKQPKWRPESGEFSCLGDVPLIFGMDKDVSQCLVRFKRRADTVFFENPPQWLAEKVLLYKEGQPYLSICPSQRHRPNGWMRLRNLLSQLWKIVHRGNIKTIWHKTKRT